MVKKIKITVILGFFFLFVFILLLNIHTGHFKIMGYEFFKLGNKKVFIKDVPHTRIISNQDSIAKYLDIEEEVAFLIIDDSTENPINKVFIDYLLMEEVTEYNQIVNLLKLDSTATVIDERIISESLITKQKIKSDLDESKVFIQSKFSKCFPYILRSRSVWTGEPQTPQLITDIFNAIEVRK